MSLDKINYKTVFLLIYIFFISNLLIAKNLDSFSDTVQHFKDERISDSLKKIELIEEITNTLESNLLFEDIIKLADEDETFIVTTKILNLRDSPNGQKIEILKEGDVVINLESQGQWFKIISIDNKVGWVSSEYLSIIDQNEKYIVERSSNQSFKDFYSNVDEFNLEKQISFESHFNKMHFKFLFDKEQYSINTYKGLSIVGLSQFLISGYEGLNISNICTEDIVNNTYENGYWCEDIENAFLNSEANQICDKFDGFFQRNTNKVLYMGCYFDNNTEDEAAIAELLDIYMKQKYDDSELYIIHYDWRNYPDQIIHKYHYDQLTSYSWFFDEDKQLHFYTYCEQSDCINPMFGLDIGNYSLLFNSMSEYVEFEKENIKAVLPKIHFEQNKSLYEDLSFMEDNFLQTDLPQKIEELRKYHVDKRTSLIGDKQTKTITELDLLKQQLHRCLELNAGVASLEKIKPVIRIEVNPDRTIKSAKVVNHERLSDPSFRTAAEAAMRAINNPDCSPLLLPEDKYDLWKEIYFTFDFGWMYD